jgi:hypothetical protein
MSKKLQMAILLHSLQVAIWWTSKTHRTLLRPKAFPQAQQCLRYSRRYSCIPGPVFDSVESFGRRLRGTNRSANQNLQGCSDDYFGANVWRVPAGSISTYVRMMGRVGDPRRCSWNPALRNAEASPVQAKAAGIRSVRGSTGYPSTTAPPRSATKQPAARRSSTVTPCPRCDFATNRQLTDQTTTSSAALSTRDRASAG